MPAKEGIPYASVKDVSSLLNANAEKFSKFEQYHATEFDGKLKQISRGSLEKLAGVYEDMNMPVDPPQLKILRTMLESVEWSSGRGGGVLNWVGHKGDYKISSLGSINLRVGTNKDGNKGYFPKRVGENVHVVFSKDGKKIIVTAE